MSESIKNIQCRLLEMAIEIKSILEAKNIPYMITFGSLLGAVRHGGFIPWDDDFDFFLFDESYDEAIMCLRQILPSDMFLEDAESEPLYFHSWAHVKDKLSIATCEQFPQDNVYTHKGLSIDLYKAIRMDERNIDLFRMKENLLYKEREYRIGLLDEQQYSLFRKDQESKIQLEEDRISKLPLMGEQLGMVVNERIMYLNEVFPLAQYRFEGTKFWGPGNADAVLKRFYGDYMRLPPEENRHPHYDNVVFIDRKG